MMGYRGAAALAPFLLLLSACGKEATGQSVAVVNDEEVSASELNAELAAANVPASADKKQVMPQLLQRVIERKLLAQAAMDQGIERTPEYIARQRRMNEELLIGLLTQRQAAAAKLPTQAEIDKFIASNPGMFGQRNILSLNQIEFDAPRDMTILKELEKDKTLDQTAATLTRLGISFTRKEGRLDTAIVPPEVMSQIDNLPAGEAFIVPAGGKVVVSVIKGRQPAALSPEQNRQLAAEAIRRQNVSDYLRKRLEEKKSAAKIEYQPGYAPKAEAGTGKAKAGAAKS